MPIARKSPLTNSDLVYFGRIHKT